MLQKKQKFSSEQVKEEVRGHIPAFTIGIPKCDLEVCYLEFDEAYDKQR